MGKGCELYSEVLRGSVTRKVGESEVIFAQGISFACAFISLGFVLDAVVLAGFVLGVLVFVVWVVRSVGWLAGGRGVAVPVVWVGLVAVAELVLAWLVLGVLGRGFARLGGFGGWRLFGRWFVRLGAGGGRVR